MRIQWLFHKGQRKNYYRLQGKSISVTNRPGAKRLRDETSRFRPVPIEMQDQVRPKKQHGGDWHSSSRKS